MYDRGRENPEFHYRSAELERMVIRVFEELIENTYQSRQIDGPIRDEAIDISRSNARSLTNELTQAIPEDYIRLTEIAEWAKYKAGEVISEAQYLLKRGYEDSRRDYRDRDRDRGGRDYGKYSRGTNRASARNLEIPGVGLSGARRGNSGDTKYERPDEKRSRLASMGSEDLQQRNRNNGTNRRNPEVIDSSAQSNRTDRPGDTVYDAYAIVAGDGGEPLSMVASPLPVLETTNDLYKQANRTSVLVGGTMAITCTKLDIHTPVTCFANAAALVEYDDATIFQSDNFCHFFNHHRVAIQTHAGSGEDVLMANNLLSPIVADSKGAVNERLANILVKLNEVQVWTRKFFVARIVRRWNMYARCNMVVPSSPNVSLYVKNLEQLLSLFPEANAVDAELADRMTQVLDNYNTTQYNTYLKDGLDWALRSVIGGRNGFVDVRRNLEYAAIDDKIPFVIDKKFRARDLYKMNQDQQKQLGAMFTKDWFCGIDQMTAVVTNLSLREIMPHERINCVSATDSPLIQVLRGSMKKTRRAYTVFSYDQGSIDYACHAGILPNGDVMLVKLQEHA